MSDEAHFRFGENIGRLFEKFLGRVISRNQFIFTDSSVNKIFFTVKFH